MAWLSVIAQWVPLAVNAGAEIARALSSGVHPDLVKTRVRRIHSDASTIDADVDGAAKGTRT